MGCLLLREDELSRKGQEKLRADIQRGVGSLGIEDEFNNVIKFRIDDDRLGLCKNCQHLEMFKTKFGNVRARCYEFDVALNFHDPVVECTHHKKRGAMSLFDMRAIAHIIEIDKRKAGFIDDETE